MTTHNFNLIIFGILPSIILISVAIWILNKQRKSQHPTELKKVFDLVTERINRPQHLHIIDEFTMGFTFLVLEQVKMERNIKPPTPPKQKAVSELRPKDKSISTLNRALREMNEGLRKSDDHLEDLYRHIAGLATLIVIEPGKAEKFLVWLDIFTGNKGNNVIIYQHEDYSPSADEIVKYVKRIFEENGWKVSYQHTSGQPDLSKTFSKS